MDRISGNFKTNKYFHKRSISQKDKGLKLIDHVESRGEHEIRLFFHIDSDCKVEIINNSAIINGKIKMDFETNPNIIQTESYPEMFKKEQNQTIILKKIFSNNTNYVTNISTI